MPWKTENNIYITKRAQNKNKLQLHLYFFCIDIDAEN